MKSLLLAWLGAVRSFLVRVLASLRGRLARFFFTRPIFKRVLLVLFLQFVLGFPLLLLVGLAPFVCWTAVLAALFLGAGAERSSTDWDALFALPKPEHFCFWRWHALERKRFQATLIALGFGLALAAIERAI